MPKRLKQALFCKIHHCQWLPMAYKKAALLFAFAVGFPQTISLRYAVAHAKMPKTSLILQNTPLPMAKLRAMPPPPSYTPTHCQWHEKQKSVSKLDTLFLLLSMATISDK
jgi:hypothetical protein